MGRRGTAVYRGKGVFPMKVETQIKNAIGKLHKRVKRTLSYPNITHRQLLELIAPPEHVETLLTIRSIANIGWFVGRESEEISLGMSSFHPREMGVEFEVNGKNTPLLPVRPAWQVTDANRDMLREIRRCADQHARVSIEWGRVMASFNWLQQNCKTPQQIRFLWPSILGIMSVDLSDELGSNITLFEARQQIAVHKQVTVPTVPVGVRCMLKETAAYVTMALLLPPLEDESQPTKDVMMRFKTDAGSVSVSPGVYEYAMS